MTPTPAAVVPLYGLFYFGVFLTFFCKKLLKNDEKRNIELSLFEIFFSIRSYTNDGKLAINLCNIWVILRMLADIIDTYLCSYAAIAFWESC